MTDTLLRALRETYAGPLLAQPEEMAPFLTDWRRQWTGHALAVAQPRTTEEVATVVRWCAAENVAITPQGGNTGLSGGSVPDAEGRNLLLSLARLNRIRAVDPLNNTMTVEAGCLLKQVQQAAAEAGRLFPLSLAAEGSCTIGGNLSTNAGGTAVLRYGNARELCLGLEVVTPAGEIWEGLRGLRKDNTGYDLRDLYIGAEGTLGIITAAALKLHPLPRSKAVAFVAVGSPRTALDLLDRAQQGLGPMLTGFELVSETCLELVLKHCAACRRPVETRAPWYVLIEASDFSDEARAAGDLEALLGRAFEAGTAVDAVVASSLAQANALWAIRENISEAQGAEGKNVKHDVSVPISKIADFIEVCGPEMAAVVPGSRPVIFGHLGDGNLHFNLSPAEGRDGVDLAAAQAEINRRVHDRVHAFGGSISAEHGLGRLRRDEAARYKSGVELSLMRTIKAALDPKGLMNPGKLLEPA